MDFGLLYENDKREYLVLNEVRMAYIRLASLVYLLVYVSTYCVPITLLRQNRHQYGHRDVMGKHSIIRQYRLQMKSSRINKLDCDFMY